MINYEVNYDFLEAYHKGNFVERVYQRKRVGAILSFIKESNLDILDLGCGTGIVLQFICKNHNVTALDISKWCIEKAKYHLKRMGLKCTLILGNLTSLPTRIKKNKYDLIMLTDVLEHQPKEKYKEIIKSLIPLLKNKGQIIISVPYKGKFNPLAYQRVYDFLRTILSGRKEESYEDIYHHHFNLKDLKDLFSNFTLLGYKKACLGTEIIALFEK